MVSAGLTDTLPGVNEGCSVDSTMTAETSASRSPPAALEEVVCSVLALLDCAKLEIDRNGAAARASLDRASVLLLDNLQRGSVNTIRARVSRLLPERQAQRIRMYIERHLGHKILVSDLGALIGCSEAHFARAFKRTFAMSPHAYITHRRVQRARHLMLVSDASLSDIALSCGLTDQAHLCKIFRELVGQSPAAWRRDRSVDVA